MSIIHLSAVASEEPSPADLAAIEAEWPLIAAELDLLDAQIREINAEPAASVLDRRRVRRAERRVLAARRELAAADQDVTDGVA
jgi:cob(I)alamin adenosyltransferase